MACEAHVCNKDLEAVVVPRSDTEDTLCMSSSHKLPLSMFSDTKFVHILYSSLRVTKNFTAM